MIPVDPLQGPAVKSAVKHRQNSSPDDTAQFKEAVLGCKKIDRKVSYGHETGIQSRVGALIKRVGHRYVTSRSIHFQEKIMHQPVLTGEMCHQCTGENGVPLSHFKRLIIIPGDTPIQNKKLLSSAAHISRSVK
ncbi:hypothetical protein FGU65_03780 [Methanoculleus sp. FWC-SCC1]|uniref:Uncharacterized protein n=1 Tax=Methanoculleus frigidifontis TaxID=2584085 RepID=A0ABT8M7W9_9EURY|nr:hypothetical protein [Methanoculleus sp. FWC-SCC1]MDN7024018.1 hypothetical protein [Methanoculleus sp. FWC-SCC1]